MKNILMIGTCIGIATAFTAEKLKADTPSQQIRVTDCLMAWTTAAAMAKGRSRSRF